MELKLYSREWCSWCIDAKDYLSEKGYRFEEIDVGKDREAYENMKELSAQTYVPTFVAGDKVLANFDTDQLEKIFNKHQIKPGCFFGFSLQSAWPCSALACALFKIRMHKKRVRWVFSLPLFWQFILLPTAGCGAW